MSAQVEGDRSMHPSAEELGRRLAAAGASPRDGGRLVAIFARPASGERLPLAEGVLDPVAGLEGDDWRARGSRRTADGRAHPEMQLTLMDVRILAAIAGHPSRFALAGDQLIVDLELGAEQLPPGTELVIGAAVIAITAFPHTGCAKFAERYGAPALALVSTAEGRRRNLRGVNARIVRRGTVRVGDPIRRIPAAPAPST